MRNLLIRRGAVAVLAGLTFAVAACSGGSEAPNETATNEIDANLMFEEPANDASAMESLANTTEPAPVTNTVEEPGNDGNVLGETSGGDTGGNTVESNVTGM